MSIQDVVADQVSDLHPQEDQAIQRPKDQAPGGWLPKRRVQKEQKNHLLSRKKVPPQSRRQYPQARSPRKKQKLIPHKIKPQQKNTEPRKKRRVLIGKSWLPKTNITAPLLHQLDRIISPNP